MLDAEEPTTCWLAHAVRLHHLAVQQLFRQVRLEFSYVDPTVLDAWRLGMRRPTKLLFAETPTNPLCEVVDIAGLARSRTRRARVLS